VQDERGPEAAHKILGLISKIMNWHSSRSDTFKSPIVRGMGRTEGNQRQRVLSDDELRRVWLACEGTLGAFVKVLLLSACRRSDISAMKWTELVGNDLIIPSDRYKTGLELVVPLSQSAKAIIDAQPHIGPYVFSTDGRTSINGFSKSKAQLDQASGVSDWVLH